MRLRLGISLVLISSASLAAPISVSSSADNGPGSLREAITTANQTPEEDTITFTTAGPIHLDTVLPTINQPIVISGPQGGRLTIDRGAAVPTSFPIFVVAADARLENLNIERGACFLTDFGGGVSMQSATTLTVNDSTFRANACSTGSAIGSPAGAQVMIARTLFAANADANTVWTSGGSIIDSTFEGNTGVNIRHSGAAQTTLTIRGVTVSGGTYGVVAQGGTSDVNNSTFADLTNQAFWTYSNGITLNLTSVTVKGPAILKDHVAVVNVKSSILAGACTGTTDLVSGGNNIATDATCGLAGTGDRQSLDPLLDPQGLANNGGPTRTIKLMPNSPAINQGPGGVSVLDQRGIGRQGLPDIGAFEVQLPGAPTVGATAGENGTLLVGFTAPANPGDSPITGYSVTCTPDNVTATAAANATSITVTGFTTNGVQSCVLSATSAYGSTSATAFDVTPGATAIVDAGTDALAPDSSTPADSGTTPPRDASSGSDARPPGADSAPPPAVDPNDVPIIGPLGSGADDCGCEAVGGPASSLPFFGLTAVLGLLVRRRRAPKTSTSSSQRRDR